MAEKIIFEQINIFYRKNHFAKTKKCLAEKIIFAKTKKCLAEKNHFCKNKKMFGRKKSFLQKNIFGRKNHFCKKKIFGLNNLWPKKVLAESGIDPNFRREISSDLYPVSRHCMFEKHARERRA